MDETNTVPESLPPQQVLIGNPTENKISGTVVQPSSDITPNAWGSAPVEEKSRSQMVWFVVGLILFPIAVGIISSSLALMSDLQKEEENYEPQKREDIQLGDETLSLNEFTMSSHFNRYYGTHDYWDLNIESNSNNENWNAIIHGDLDEGDGDFGFGTELDDSGSTWTKINAYGGGETLTVYLQVEGNIIRVASPQDLNDPNYVNYYSYDSDQTIFDLESVSLILWPISVIAGVVWGLTTDRRGFSYGVMIWGSVVLLYTALILTVMILW
tara:strand:+ start:5404 stop:6213 length:810 start_codon:yes stop_codon:yes gene_type:complete